MWGQIAQDLLEAAADALADGDTIRKAVYTGPDFRRDCRQLAVSLDGTQQTDQPAGVIPGRCATMTRGNFRVWLTDNCVPSGEEAPPAADITAYSAGFLNEAKAVHDALLAVCDQIARRCSSVTVGDGGPSSPAPTGTFTTWSIPVTVVGI